MEPNVRTLRIHAGVGLSLLALGCVLLVSCDDATIQSYTAPRDQPIPAAALGPMQPPPPPSEIPATAPTTQTAATTAPASKQLLPDAILQWTLPTGWREDPTPHPMRRATFLAGEGEQAVEISITQFPGDVGGIGANVNRWRAQVGLPALPDPTKQLYTPAMIGKHPIALMQFDGPTSPQRDAMNHPALLVAVVPLRNDTAFIKMTGTSTAVARQHEAFMQFVTTLVLGDATP